MSTSTIRYPLQLYGDMQAAKTRENAIVDENKRKRYSRWPRLSDTRYLLKGPKGNGEPRL